MGESTAKIRTAAAVTRPQRPLAVVVSIPASSTKVAKKMGMVVATSMIKAEFATS